MPALCEGQPKNKFGGNIEPEVVTPGLQPKEHAVPNANNNMVTND